MNNRCKDCGKKLNPVGALLSGEHGICGDCTREKHRRTTRGETEEESERRRAVADAYLSSKFKAPMDG